MSGKGTIKQDSAIGLIDKREKMASPPVSAPLKTADENKNLAIMTKRCKKKCQKIKIKVTMKKKLRTRMT